MTKTFAERVRTSIPANIRGGMYYAIHYLVVSVFFSYISVAYIERGMTGVQLGTLNSLGSIVMLIASPLLTGIADRKGWHLPFLSIGNILYGIAMMSINFAPTFAVLAFITAIASFIKAPTNPIGEGLIIRMANKYGLNFGSMRIWGSISFTIFCISAGWLWDVIGLEWLFWIGGGLFILRSLMGFVLEPIEQKTDVKPAAEKARPQKGEWLSPLKTESFSST